MNLPAVLRPPGFRRLLAGQAVSAFGDWMGTIALMALVLELTGSATAVGGVLALRLLPAMLAGPVATGAAVRWDRRRTMLAMDLVRAGLVVLVPLVAALWWVYTLAFLVEVANLVFLPARDAAIPDLLDDKRRLPAANGLVLVSSYGNIPLGAGAFAGLSSLSTLVGGALGNNPFVVVFAVDAVTYLVSFALIRSLELTGAGDEPSGEDMSPWRAFVEAFRLPLLRAVLPGLSTVAVGAGALFSLGIVYVEEVLGASTAEFGVMIAIFGVGAGVAVAWVQGRAAGPTVRMVRTGVAAMGVLLAVMSLSSSLGAAYLVAVAFGAAAATALVGGISFLQERLTGMWRTLGFTAFHVLLRVGLSLSAVVAGLVAERIAAVRWPVVGPVAPTSLVMSAAGVLMVVGAVAIRPAAVRQALEEPI